MRKTGCQIVIPLYKNKELLSANELFSLKNNMTILHNWPHVFIGPDHIDWDGYRKLFSESDLEFKIEIFDSQFFKSVAGYNTLLTSAEFYKRFTEDEFILICQLDAWVFKDELEYWCRKGYDYIGAPWFEGLKSADESSEIIGAGNGGFSLRNIKSSIRLQKRINFLRKLRTFWFKSHLQALWRFPNMILYLKKWFHVSSITKLNFLLLENPFNEDYYWANIIAETFTDYQVADLEDSIKFSFEVNPRLLYKRNNNTLPFGCHGWEKYDPIFWSTFIQNNYPQNI